MRTSTQVARSAAAVALAFGAITVSAADAGAKPLDNAQACKDYATRAHHLDPAHNYVCVNKANNVSGYDNCVNQGKAWHPVRFWCTHDPWPWYDLDGVVITR